MPPYNGVTGVFGARGSIDEVRHGSVADSPIFGQILFKENNNIAGFATRHNHGGIFNGKVDCWRQTHVTRFGEGTFHCM